MNIGYSDESILTDIHMYCTIIVLYYCSRYNTIDKAEVFVVEEGEAPKNTLIRRKNAPIW